MSFTFVEARAIFSLKGVTAMDQEKIGSFIAENRKAKGFTQIEFAEKLGVSNKSVSRWETGKNMPDVSLFLPICDALNISVNELLIGERIATQENKKADEIFVETIQASNKKLKSAQIVIYILAVLVNALFMIGVPLTATPVDAMAVPLAALLGGAVSALLLSCLNIKPIWLFIFIPISVIELLVGSIIYCGALYDYGLPYATILAFVQLTLFLLAMGIRKIIRKLIKTKRKNKSS